MPYNLPHRIRNEADLKFFEDYLSLEKENHREANTLLNLLKNQVGKPIKLDLGSNRYMGILVETGADYLKLCTNQSCCVTIIPIYAVKSVSFNKN